LITFLSSIYKSSTVVTDLTNYLESLKTKTDQQDMFILEICSSISARIPKPNYNLFIIFLFQQKEDMQEKWSADILLMNLVKEQLFNLRCLLIDEFIYIWVYWLVGLLIDAFIDWQVYWLMGLLIDEFIDWWVIGWWFIGSIFRILSFLSVSMRIINQLWFINYSILLYSSS
jgi:hypothetical protein